MIIIGEKINGSIPSTAAAIQTRDEAYIVELINKQVAAGANYLDVCAGTSPDVEYDTLCWLIDLVQTNTDTPICIDSPDPRMIERVLPLIKHPGMINSISGEGEKCAILLPLLANNPEWHSIVLCCDNQGIPEHAQDKFAIAQTLIKQAQDAGVSQDRLHVDPLVMALSTVQEGPNEFIKALKLIKEAYPDVHLSAGISNVSYGMPARGVLNRNFLALAMAAGLDTPIIDPSAKSIAETLYAVSALMGNDRFCRKYNNAYRQGLIGNIQ